MFQQDLQKLEKKFDKYKKTVAHRSQMWGKTKYSPNTFHSKAPQPPVEEAAIPWKHVRNDILDDEQAETNSNRCNVNSQEGKHFLKNREQSHRRNMIETSRKASTTWEKFNDDGAHVKSNPKPRYRPYVDISKNPENFTANDRNFIRRRLTRAAMYDSGSFKSSMKNMSKHSGIINKWIPKDKDQPINNNNKFRNN